MASPCGGFRVATDRVISPGRPQAAARVGGAGCLPGIRGLCNPAGTECGSLAGRYACRPPARIRPGAGEFRADRTKTATCVECARWLAVRVEARSRVRFVALQQRIARRRGVAAMTAGNVSATDVAFRRSTAVRDAGAGPVIVGACRPRARHPDGARSAVSEGAGSPGVHPGVPPDQHRQDIPKYIRDYTRN
jgi:hypothetical protein